MPRLRPASLATVAVTLLAAALGLPRAAADGSAGKLQQPAMLDFIPSYWRDVRPILEERCLACHREGGIAPFSLEEADAAVANAQEISFATREKRMPPWLPGPQSPHFLDERVLSEREIAVLTNWYWAGAPLGKADTAAARTAQATRQADLLVDAGRDFTPSKDLSDEYRCFVIDPKINEERWLSGYDIAPGDTRSVHHVLLFSVSAAALEQARALEAKADGRGGYTCFGGINVGASAADRIRTRSAEAEPSVSYLGSWTPGATAVTFPAGAGVLLKPGAQMVMQVHYNTAAGVRPDRTAAKLFLAPRGTTLRPIRLTTLIAPVEIPCPAGQEGDRCSRDAAYEAVRPYQEPALTDLFKAGLLLNYCRQALPARGDGRVSTSCDFTLSRDRLILGVQGHMHLLGTSLSIEANPGTPAAQVLLDIPRWDFHWQGGYWLSEPIALGKGDRVRITCRYDNGKEAQHGGHAPKAEPRYVVWGEGTADEMCLGALMGVNR